MTTRSPRPPRGRVGRAGVLQVGAAVAVLSLLVAACQSDAGSDAADSASSSISEDTTPGTDGLVLVALGDSASTGHGDPTGRGWVVYYGELIGSSTGQAVEVRNLAEDGTTTEALLDRIRTDDAVRTAISEADVVAIGMGGNELNMGDAAMEAGSCEDTDCYDQPVELYRTNLDAIVSEIENIRAGQPTVLRAIGSPNALTGAEDIIPPFLKPVATKVGVYEARLLDTATCKVMAAHRGACAALLKAFNGTDGTQNAYDVGLLNLDDCCYPTEAGQRLIAKVLFKTGLDATRP